MITVREYRVQRFAVPLRLRPDRQRDSERVLRAVHRWAARCFPEAVFDKPAESPRIAPIDPNLAVFVARGVRDVRPEDRAAVQQVLDMWRRDGAFYDVIRVPAMAEIDV